MKKFIDRINEIHINSDNQKIQIIEYFNSYNTTIKFLNSGRIRKNIIYSNIKSGSVRDFYNPTMEGIGYLGEGKFKLTTHKKFFNIWSSMLTRCYNGNYQKLRESYVGCSVDKRWHNFQVFAEWCETNYVEGFVLDKDILIKGNKVYSPDTCCFVPAEINAMFIKTNKLRGKYPIGVSENNKLFSATISINKKKHCKLFKTPEEAFNYYCLIKKEHIINIANKWKDKIKIETFNTLINYNIEITD